MALCAIFTKGLCGFRSGMHMNVVNCINPQKTSLQELKKQKRLIPISLSTGQVDMIRSKISTF